MEASDASRFANGDATPVALLLLSVVAVGDTGVCCDVVVVVAVVGWVLMRSDDCTRDDVESID